MVMGRVLHSRSKSGSIGKDRKVQVVGPKRQQPVRLRALARHGPSMSADRLGNSGGDLRRSFWAAGGPACTVTSTSTAPRWPLEEKTSFPGRFTAYHGGDRRFCCRLSSPPTSTARPKNGFTWEADRGRWRSCSAHLPACNSLRVLAIAQGPGPGAGRRSAGCSPAATAGRRGGPQWTWPISGSPARSPPSSNNAPNYLVFFELGRGGVPERG